MNMTGGEMHTTEANQSKDTVAPGKDAIEAYQAIVKVGLCGLSKINPAPISQISWTVNSRNVECLPL